MRSLARLTATLLDAAAPDGALESACRELYVTLHDAAGVTFAPLEGTQLPTGYALDVGDAARCILDTKRTVAFLRGTWAALAELQVRFPSGPIDVVYAGCGPFAPLVLPLLPLVDGSRFRFTLLDVHATALHVLKSLALPDNARLVCADAARYRHATPIHAVLTETMQQALVKEPFVAIVANLCPQLHAGGILVPERVTVTAAAIDAEGEKARWNGVAGSERHADLGTLSVVDPVTIAIPKLDVREQWLGLLTTIETFGGHALATYDSGLTMPHILWSASPLRSGDVLEIAYGRGPSPGFRSRTFSGSSRSASTR